MYSIYQSTFPLPDSPKVMKQASAGRVPDRPCSGVPFRQLGADPWCPQAGITVQQTPRHDASHRPSSFSQTTCTTDAYECARLNPASLASYLQKRPELTSLLCHPVYIFLLPQAVNTDTGWHPLGGTAVQNVRVYTTTFAVPNSQGK